MQILRAKGYSFKDEVSYIKNCSDINYVFMDVNNYFIKSDVFVKGHFFRDINFVEVFLKDIFITQMECIVDAVTKAQRTYT